MPASSPHPARAALLMLASMLSFALMTVAIRLASASLPTFEIAFFRNFFGLLALTPLLVRAGPAILRTRQLPKYLLRSAVGICSMFASFWAIGHLALSQAISLAYSTPLFVTIAAVIWLGEIVRLRRWVAVIVGFVGVLVIVQPWSHAFSAGSLVALLGAVLGAMVAVQIKQLSAIDPADTIVFYTYAFWVPLSLVPALLVWQWPQGIAWLWLVCTGVLGTMGQVLWTRALKLGDVSVLTPISFIQLPVVALAGWWLFGETLNRWTVIGAGIIFAANAYIAHREAVLARRAATTAPIEAAKPGE
ncbi:MAG: DMT family transporter [Luteimonas sp.]